MAREVRRLFALDRVLLMVASHPPHKEGHSISDGYHRYVMSVLETLDEPGVWVSSLELRRPELRFTVGLLDERRRLCPDERTCFIAGSDSLLELKHWKECDRLVEEHCFVFVQRRGKTVLRESEIPVSLRSRLRQLRPQTQPVIGAGISYLVDVQAPDISSTVLRETLAAGGRPSDREMSPLVIQYAQKCALYEQNQDQENPETSL